MLFIILVILVGYSALTAEFARAAEFMFSPDLSKINKNVVLLALGQAFFSLSVGGGGIIAYGAYLTKTASIPRTALVVAGANVSVDMLAGLAIFPIVFAYGLETAAGPVVVQSLAPLARGARGRWWIRQTLGSVASLFQCDSCTGFALG